MCGGEESKRTRWLEHIVRMKEGRVPRSLFIKKTYFGTRSDAERQRLTWEESVKMDLNRLNVVNWMPQARDRKKWGKILDQALPTKWM